MCACVSTCVCAGAWKGGGADAGFCNAFVKSFSTHKAKCIYFIYLFFLFSSVFICVFYAEKMREAFAQQKLLLFFQQKKEMFLHAI